MFKFKSLISEKGSYFYNDTLITYKNYVISTEDKQEAEYLRKNREFKEIVEENQVIETGSVVSSEEKETKEKTGFSKYTKFPNNSKRNKK